MADPVTLPGTLPGLLAPYAPVVLSICIEDGFEPSQIPGVLLEVDLSDRCGDIDTVGYYSDPRIGKGRYYAQNVALNLSTPEGMCRAARWLAERMGMDPGATAPLWYSVEESGGDVCWFLKSTNARGEVYGHGFFVATKDPAEALRLACLAVGGTP